MENFDVLLEQAKNGDALSQYKLGRAYEIGDGVEKNMATARMWYQKSADNGYKNAEVKLRLLPVQEDTIVAEPVPQKQTYQAPSAPPLTTAANTQKKTENNTQQSNVPAQNQTNVGPKSKAVAALLAFFLGYFGAHDFYLGYKKQGIIKIIFSITIILSFVTYIWTLIDFIRILCNGKLDSNGQLLK